MESPWPNRCATLLAAAAFFSVLTGAAVTNNEERPYYLLGQGHIWLGAATAILTIVLLIWARTEKRLWLRRMTWIALAAVAAQALLGLQRQPQAPAVRIAHALVAQLFFPLTVGIAVWTSAGWKKAPGRVDCSSALRLLTIGTPVLVLGQVALGTLFRHGAMGVGPHLIGAFLVAFFILGLGLPIVYRPDHSSLHLATRLFLTIASVQVALGLALFSMQSMNVDPQAVILITIIHAATGALTLAATMMVAVLIRRTIG